MVEIIGIDPGPTKSACVHLSREQSIEILEAHLLDNSFMLAWLDSFKPMDRKPVLAVEMVQSFGMPVGREVFETVFWVGRFVERWPAHHIRIHRPKIKTHLCGSPRAKDANVRQALIDRVGPQGTKKSPGPTYGMKGDIWSALAVAVTAHDDYLAGDS